MPLFEHVTQATSETGSFWNENIDPAQRELVRSLTRLLARSSHGVQRLEQQKLRTLGFCHQESTGPFNHTFLPGDVTHLGSNPNLQRLDRLLSTGTGLQVFSFLEDDLGTGIPSSLLESGDGVSVLTDAGNEFFILFPTPEAPAVQTIITGNLLQTLYVLPWRNLFTPTAVASAERYLHLGVDFWVVSGGLVFTEHPANLFPDFRMQVLNATRESYQTLHHYSAGLDVLACAGAPEMVARYGQSPSPTTLLSALCARIGISVALEPDETILLTREVEIRGMRHSAVVTDAGVRLLPAGSVPASSGAVKTRGQPFGSGLTVYSGQEIELQHLRDDDSRIDAGLFSPFAGVTIGAGLLQVTVDAGSLSWHVEEDVVGKGAAFLEWFNAATVRSGTTAVALLMDWDPSWVEGDPVDIQQWLLEVWFREMAWVVVFDTALGGVRRDAVAEFVEQNRPLDRLVILVDMP